MYPHELRSLNPIHSLLDQENKGCDSLHALSDVNVYVCEYRHHCGLTLRFDACAPCRLCLLQLHCLAALGMCVYIKFF